MKWRLSLLTTLALCAGIAWGQDDAVVTVLEDEGRFILNPDYQVLRLIARTVSPGSRRLAAFLNHGEAIAFERPDGSRVALFVNPGEIRNGHDMQRSKA